MRLKIFIPPWPTKPPGTTIRHLDRSEYFGATTTYLGSYVRPEIKGWEAKCLVRPTAKGKKILGNISKTQLQSHTKTCIFTSCKKEQLRKSQNIHYSGSCMSTSYFKPSNSGLYQSASVPKELLQALTVLPPLNHILSSTKPSCCELQCCKWETGCSKLKLAAR